jgi:hypothetical protein
MSLSSITFAARTGTPGWPSTLSARSRVETSFTTRRASMVPRVATACSEIDRFASE